MVLAAEYPERVSALVDIASDLPLSAEPSDEPGYPFDEVADTDEGWAKWNRHYWLRDWPGFVEFFFTEAFTEPHSTKQIEDAIGWGLQADPQTMVRGMEADWPDRGQALELCGRVRCPVLVVQGTHDRIVGPARGPAVAEAIPGAGLLVLEGSGHAPQGRDGQLRADRSGMSRPAPGAASPKAAMRTYCPAASVASVISSRESTLPAVRSRRAAADAVMREFPSSTFPVARRAVRSAAIAAR